MRHLTWLARTVLPPLSFFLAVLILWHVAVEAFSIKPFLLPGPLRVAAAIDAHLATLLNAAWLTAMGALCGFLLSFVVGFFISLVFSQSKIIERSLYPYAIFLQTVPIVAVAPLIILWIGHGFHGVVAVSFIISLFPIIANATNGLTSVEQNLVDLFQMNNASRWQLLMKLRVPNAVPNLLTGARISSGLSVIGAIVGEFVGSEAGLGYLILQMNFNFDLPGVFAVLIILSMMSIGLHMLVIWVQGHVVFWVDKAGNRVMGA